MRIPNVTVLLPCRILTSFAPNPAILFQYSSVPKPQFLKCYLYQLYFPTSSLIYDLNTSLACAHFACMSHIYNFKKLHIDRRNARKKKSSFSPSMEVNCVHKHLYFRLQRVLGETDRKRCQCRELRKLFLG